MSEETKKPKAEKAKNTQKVATKATSEVKEVKEVETIEVIEDAPTEVKEQTQEDFLNNFNWHKYEEGIEVVDDAKLKEFENALEGTVGFVKERDVIEGLVVRITDRDAIIDINSKSEGVISLNEYRYNSSLAVGDKVEVLVD